MQNLIVTFNIVAPFLLYMLFGALMKRAGYITDDFHAKLNKLVSSTILPIFNFYNLIKADLSALKEGGYIVYVLVGQIVMLAVYALLVHLLKRSPARAGAMVDTMFVNNTMVFGCAIALAMYGEGNFAPMLLVAAILLPLYNGLVIPVIQIYGSKQAALDQSEDGQSVKVSTGKLLLDVLKNPLVIAVFCGLIYQFSGIEFPEFAMTFLSGLSATLTPLIFIILGAGFTFKGFMEDRKDLILCLLIKLVIAPAIMIILPLKFGYRDTVLIACLLAFASPSGVTTASVVKSCGCDERFAGEMVALSSGLSILSLFLWIFLFKTLGLV